MERGQQALQFIMTYGWALVVILLAGGALWFTLGGEQAFVSETCLVGPGLYCSDFRVDEGSIILKLKNSLGKDVQEFSLLYSGCGIESATVSLENGRDDFFAVSGCTFGPNEIFNGILDMSYMFVGSTIEHSRSASIIGVVQEGDSQSFGGPAGFGGSGSGSSGGGYIPDGNTIMLCNFDDTLECEVGGLPSGSSDTNFEDGYYGRAVTVLSENGYLIYPTNNVPLNLGEGTLEAWVYVDDDLKQQNYQFIFSHTFPPPNLNNSITFHYRSDSSPFKWEVLISDDMGLLLGNYSLISYPDTLEDGWHHFAVVWDKDIDGGYVEIFIDGVSVVNSGGHQDNFPVNPNYDFYIGSSLIASSWDANTPIDEFRLSNIARY